MSTTPDSYLKLKWSTQDRFAIEAAMYRNGGYIHGCGNGKAYHFKEAMRALWPHFDWNKWSKLLIQNFVEWDETGIMGPASSGKTYCSAAFGLCTFYIYPKNTSVLMSTTTRDGLQLRIWGAIKELHNKAKERRQGLPGKIREAKFMLTNDDDTAEAEDFRDGIIGIACKVGGTFVGLSNYVGLKNDRVILIADEASLMGRGFIDSVANLRKNPSFKLIAMGNPKERMDALGVVCEPSPQDGGWEGLEYKEVTRTWRTRSPHGIAIQLCGYDSPNYDYPKGLNPHKGIITPEQIETDLAYYGKDSLQFSMMNLGCMPRDGGSRRVITISLCEQNQAFEEPAWESADRLTRVVGVDAAYSGVGGDRCVLTDLQFGPDVNGKILLSLAEPQTIIPISSTKAQQAEEQITDFVRSYCESRKIPPENMGLDSTGRGTLVSALARKWSPAVIPVEFGGKALERQIRLGDPKLEIEAYGKMVTALWFASRIVIEAKQFRKLSREMAEEGAYREWGVNRDARIDVEPKDKTKERMGRSPDLWDSLVVAIEVARRRGFHIAAGPGVNVIKRSAPNFLSKLRRQYDTTTKGKALSYK